MELLEKYTELEVNEYAISVELEKKQNELNDLMAKNDIFNAIKNLQEEVSNINKQKADMKEQLKIAMEESGVKKFENDVVAITYVTPTTIKGVDTTKFKTEFADVYEQCIKISNVKASIRIKVKEVKVEEPKEEINIDGIDL